MKGRKPGQGRKSVLPSKQCPPHLANTHTPTHPHKHVHTIPCTPHAHIYTMYIHMHTHNTHPMHTTQIHTHTYTCTHIIHIHTRMYILPHAQTIHTYTCMHEHVYTDAHIYPLLLQDRMPSLTPRSVQILTLIAKLQRRSSPTAPAKAGREVQG